jgi:hypothetical protein
MKAGLVLTSIFVPECLEGYRRNFAHYGHLEDVEVFMISDMKTPGEAWDLCTDLRHAGMNVHCVSVIEQEEFVIKLGLNSAMFPINTDHRRNIGYLMALAKGVDFVVSIDDDNYCRDGVDYFAEHAIVYSTAYGALSSDSGWLNPCDRLETTHLVYQRGFPYFARQHEFKITQPMSSSGFTIHVNEGLWFGEPDLDALTWLVTPDKSSYAEKSIVVAKDTWAPINSQNTALCAEAVAAYYFIPMNPPVFDRFGDIFQGYFLQAVMKHLGGHLRIGTPIVEHRRNSHSYFVDAERELPCIQMLEELLPWLTKDCKLSGSNYCDTYESLSERLREWSDSNFFQNVADDMKQWVKACRTIGVGVGKVAA